LTRWYSRTQLALVVALGGCGSHAAAPPPPPPPRASVPTPWVPARSPSDVSLLEMPAQVAAAPQSVGAVVPPFPARVLRIAARPGDHVDKGAPLIDVLMPQLVSAAGAYTAARTRVDAYGKRKRQLEQLRAEGLVKIVDLSDAETRLAEAHADEETALATLHAAGVSPSEAARMLAAGGRVTLRSPVGGTVTELHAVVGETRDANGNALVRVVGAGAPRIEARLSQQLPEGARFEFVSPAKERTPLRLVAQAPVVDPRDGTRATWFEPVSPMPLAAGASGRLRVLLPAGARAVVVPATAVASDAHGSWVVVQQGQTSRKVAVHVIASSGADALVEGAVEPGQSVAADATAAPTDGGAP
jgi:cobalt-zinc-cadmium efflux system membrane fusion protein